MITGDIIIKSFNLGKKSPMIRFFQVIFFTAAIVLIVLNVLEYNKWQEGRKPGSLRPPHPLKWFYFILTSLVAIGCVLNIFIDWIS
jgi:hypothetical protein